MPWTPGAYNGRAGGAYLHRTPVVQGRPNYVLEAATKEEFGQLVDMFEIGGREPLDLATIRQMLGPKALLGETE